MFIKRIFSLLLFLLAIGFNQTLLGQEIDNTQVQKPRSYVKTLNGEVFFYQALSKSNYKFSGINGSEKTVYKSSEIHSGCRMRQGVPTQFIIGKIQKQGGTRVFVPGKYYYEVLVYDNGTMLISEYYDTRGSTPVASGNNEWGSTGYKYYIVRNSEVTPVPVLRKNIEGWENIFTGCPEYATIIEAFYARETGNGTSIHQLIQELSTIYYRKQFTIF